MKHLKKLFRLICRIFIFIMAAIAVVNLIILRTTAKRIFTVETVENIDGCDCILVLGCSVKPDGNPSDMLHDRLVCGVELYRKAPHVKLLMSGDHSRDDYNEVAAMKQYAIGQGVPSADIFLDHAGLSTYESIYRAKKVFGVQKMVIVTQKYHLARALYIAEKLGVEAIGVSSDLQTYRGQEFREVREILARTKDFAYAQLKPVPQKIGQPISLKGNGEITDRPASVEPVSRNKKDCRLIRNG